MGAYSDRVIADGATHYWRLGEPSGTTAADSIVAGNAPGTISGGVTLGQPGPLADGSKAMTFNGSTGKVQTGSLVSLVEPFSLEGWLRETSPTSNVAAVSTQPAGAGQGHVSLWSDSQHLRVNWTYVPGGTGLLAGTRIIDDNQWHHVVVTLTAGAVLTTYVDGTLDGQTTLTGSIAETNRQFAMGTSIEFPANGWPGAIAEVAIYPTALSAPTISAHYALRTATGAAAGRPISLGMWRQILP